MRSPISQNPLRPVGLALVIGAVLTIEPVPPGSAAGEHVARIQTEHTVRTPDSAPAELSLSAGDWAEVDRSIDGALAWLRIQQLADGSFRSDDRAQPAVTSLAVMAFLARGHLPGQGPHGEPIDRAIAYVLSCQKPDGLLSRLVPEAQMMPGMASHTATYNHAIAGLMLSEVFGMTDRRGGDRLAEAIRSALACSLRLQTMPSKRSMVDRGGWRYVRRWAPSDSDLSITSWHLMFLRSARNAGFAVSAAPIDEAMQYVGRCYQRNGTFLYGLIGMDRHTSPAMVGAGIVSLSLGGRHGTEAARKAGDWLLVHPLPRQYGSYRFHYNAFYATLGMYQLGGHYWAGFYPAICRTVLRHQQPDGSWPPEAGEQQWGPCLTTSLAVLTLGTPYQLLPIFQR